MGYTTDFAGSFKLSRRLTEEEKNYIKKFSNTRRMKRDVNTLMELFGGKHGLPEVVSYKPGVLELIERLRNEGFHASLMKIDDDKRTPQEIYGVDGEFFVGAGGFGGQDNDASVINYNVPPQTQPSLWCQWVIGGNDDQIEWDGNEKFYCYDKWIQYMVTNFFKPWGITVNGEVTWQGEDSTDMGKIVITDNGVEIKVAKVTYE